MDAKLTLKLDKQVIERAKAYASRHKRSLSRLIESYLKSLDEIEHDQLNDEPSISSFVKSMQTGVKLPLDLDHKKAYGNYLAEKYK